MSWQRNSLTLDPVKVSSPPLPHHVIASTSIGYTAESDRGISPDADRIAVTASQGMCTRTFMRLPTARAALGVGGVSGLIYAVGGRNATAALATNERFTP
jgi:hypothetical protein